MYNSFFRGHVYIYNFPWRKPITIHLFLIHNLRSIWKGKF